MAAFRRRGLTVQGFKVGPDFIDPGHHALVTGRPSHNIDGWMLSRDENRTIFARHVRGADLAVVEGVMGLYDGFDPAGEVGSTAQAAKWLGLPVLLCVGAGSMARSLAALALGFREFDPGLIWLGLAANRVAGPRHTEILRTAMESVPAMPFLGGMPRREDIGMDERHLGLITAEDRGMDREGVTALADWIEEALDLDNLWRSLPDATLPRPPEKGTDSKGSRVRLAVARDRAFCFYYEENLRRLEEAGADPVFFSPLRDPCLPEGTAGLYLGGGYPELCADELAENRSLCDQIARLGRDGLPVYAECGGMMYLGRALKDMEGHSLPMVGLLPVEFRMLSRLQSLGYREVTFLQDTPLGPAGTVARGHEFHYSEASVQETAPGLETDAYRARGSRGPVEECRGYRLGNTLASYVHLHFGSNPALAESFAASCRTWEERRREVRGEET
jgi:cobyrinic acid a,c-diamide synthase